MTMAFGDKVATIGGRKAPQNITVLAGPGASSSPSPGGDYLTRLLADALYAPVAHTHPWSAITSKPTTLAGYGITDAQPASAELTAIAGLSSPGYIKRTGPGTYVAVASIPVADVSGLTGWATKAFTNGSTTDVAEGTRLYYTDARARTALSATSPLSYNSSTGVISHLATDGNLHVPATGTGNNGRFLRAGATAGSLAWIQVTPALIGAAPGHSVAANYVLKSDGSGGFAASNIIDTGSQVSISGRFTAPAYATTSGTPPILFGQNFTGISDTACVGIGVPAANSSGLTRPLVIRRGNTPLFVVDDMGNTNVYGALVVSGLLQFSTLGAGFVKSNSSGIISVDSASYVQTSAMSGANNQLAVFNGTNSVTSDAGLRRERIGSTTAVLRIGNVGASGWLSFSRSSDGADIGLVGFADSAEAAKITLATYARTGTIAFRLLRNGGAAVDVGSWQNNGVLLASYGVASGANGQISALKDSVPAAASNVLYSQAPIVVERLATSGTTAVAGIGFHNRGVNAALLYYDAATSVFKYNRETANGIVTIWDSSNLGVSGAANQLAFFTGANSVSSDIGLTRSIAGGVTNAVIVGHGALAAETAFVVQNDGTNDRDINFKNANLTTWSVRTTGISDNWVLRAHGIDDPITVARAGGSAITFSRPLYMPNLSIWGTARAGDGGRWTHYMGGGTGGVGTGTSNALIQRYQYGGFDGFVVGNAEFYGITQDHQYGGPGAQLSIVAGAAVGRISFFAGTPTLQASGNYQAPRVGDWTNSGLSIIGELYATSTLAWGGGGAIASSANVVRGQNSTRTTTTDWTAALPSGFYDNAVDTPTGGWCHAIIGRHTNEGNNYQSQIVTDFENDRMWFRRIHNGSVNAWREFWHTGNLSSSTLPGGPYLPLAGGVVSGSTTFSSGISLGAPITIGTGNFLLLGGTGYIMKAGNGIDWDNAILTFQGSTTGSAFRFEGRSRFNKTAEFTNTDPAFNNGIALEAANAKVGGMMQVTSQLFTSSSTLPVMPANSWCFVICDSTAPATLYWSTNSTQPVRWMKGTTSTQTPINTAVGPACNAKTYLLIGPPHAESSVCTMLVA